MKRTCPYPRWGCACVGPLGADRLGPREACPGGFPRWGRASSACLGPPAWLREALGRLGPRETHLPLPALGLCLSWPALGCPLGATRSLPGRVPPQGTHIECPLGAACLAARSSPGWVRVDDHPLGMRTVELANGSPLELPGTGNSLQACYTCPSQDQERRRRRGGQSSYGRRPLRIKGPDSSRIRQE